jgi:hypothetical protein
MILILSVLLEAADISVDKHTNLNKIIVWSAAQNTLGNIK